MTDTTRKLATIVALDVAGYLARTEARACAYMGLAQYWLASGEWPDCADEVPYDFRAECHKAVREVVKA